MKVQAEISLYPLGEKDSMASIEKFLNVLEDEHLEPRAGPMSTTVIAESEAFFQAISRAFEKVGTEHRCVLVLKCSTLPHGPASATRLAKRADPVRQGNPSTKHS